MRNVPWIISQCLVVVLSSVLLIVGVVEAGPKEAPPVNDPAPAGVEPTPEPPVAPLTVQEAPDLPAEAGDIQERGVPLKLPRSTTDAPPPSGMAPPGQGVKSPRPAATAPSPEENRQEKLPPPAKPADLRAPTLADMEAHCLKNPKCQAKLGQAKQGKRPATPLPAATGPSPEEKLQKSLPAPAQGLPPMGPRSYIPGQVERFFSMFNPFAPDLAWAQTPFTITLTPTNRYNATPSAYLSLWGVVQNNPSNSYIILENGYSSPHPVTENKPFVSLQVNVPAAGYYLIDVYGYKSLTKLIHGPTGQILEAWDYRAGCGLSSACHYVTVDYYAAGPQFWYFWAAPTTWGTYFYSITIKSYP